jgi:hypothetical protein
LKFPLFISLLVALLFTFAASAQIRVQGTIFDSSRTYPLEAVSVMTSDGKGTVTDQNGFYKIDVKDADTIWFSYQGKPTIRFPVKKISYPMQFDLALKIPVTVMPEVKIRPRNYRQDSLQNRIDYAKAFNYQKVSVGSMTSIGPGGAGIDLNELIRLFQFRKNKSMLLFQARVVQQEKDAFIDQRFNRSLVRRLTGLTGESLEVFMQLYRPTYEFTKYTSDYDFQLYIRESANIFQSKKSF